MLMRPLHSLLLLLAALLAPASVLAQTCPRVLVSGYYSTVHVYDGCSGSHLRMLDARSRLTGAQAIRQRDGFLYVIAEGHGEVHRYRADSLEFVDTPYRSEANAGITGIDFDSAGAAYVGRYSRQDVLRFANAGAQATTAVAARAGGIAGPDNGLVFGPDGALYVPGYDSSSVIRFDPATGETRSFVAAGSGGLYQARGLLFLPDGSLLVSSEGGDQILRYGTDGEFLGVFTTLPNGFRPTGLARLNGSTLLVAGSGSNSVLRVDAHTGTLGSPLVVARAGGLSGATFVSVLSAPEPAPDASQIGSQYWVTGAGLAQGKRLVVDDIYSAGGAAFGAAFRPQDIQTRRWGSLRIEFTDCSRGLLSWDSTGDDSAHFGLGGYPIVRLLPTAEGDRCSAQGLGAFEGASFMSGVWYGGGARSGEGLFIDVSSAGPISVAFFTHRPATP
jgi:sugar lactone lactonase YvrE